MGQGAPSNNVFSVHNIWLRSVLALTHTRCCTPRSPNWHGYLEETERSCSASRKKQICTNTQKAAAVKEQLFPDLRYITMRLEGPPGTSRPVPCIHTQPRRQMIQRDATMKQDWAVLSTVVSGIWPLLVHKHLFITLKSPSRVTHLATASRTCGSCSHFFRASTLLVFRWGLASRKIASDQRIPKNQVERFRLSLIQRLNSMLLRAPILGYCFPEREPHSPQPSRRAHSPLWAKLFLILHSATPAAAPLTTQELLLQVL